MCHYTAEPAPLRAHLPSANCCRTVQITGAAQPPEALLLAYIPSRSGTDLLSWVKVCYKGSSVSQSVATWVESSATGPPTVLKNISILM